MDVPVPAAGDIDILCRSVDPDRLKNNPRSAVGCQVVWRKKDVGLEEEKMKVDTLSEIIGADFYTGVPDSQLRALCDYLMDRHGIDPKHHVIGANEGKTWSM